MARERWRLHRAGIVNVYQYEDEVLSFGGGRLLLRGVNGSGKSTAMNMLLPFLLTTRQGRIDAAGEQSGILKSWMLNGRDDAQPVGYLWIEFERQGEFLVCGCGIKANRQSDTVTTWWFVTSKRPGLDLRLVGPGGVPRSALQLRAALDGDEVFGDRRRRDYRRTIEQRLFGGASIDQHIGLIHRVRNPRVGDRIDVDLPAHLVDALPQLSEQALAEAAQPLDDLEEHRRNVAELEQTSAAIRGLLDVYRSYCLNELRQRIATGRARLDVLRQCARDEKRRHRDAEAAGIEVGRLEDEIGGIEEDARRLRSEIAALEESQVYRSGQELDALRDLVSDLAGQHANAAERVTDRQQRVEAEVAQLRQARRRSRDDLTQLNEDLANATELCGRSRVARRPPGPVEVPESAPAGIDAAEPTGLTEPVGVFDAVTIDRRIAAADGAVLERLADIEQVEKARTRLNSAEEQLSRAQSVLEAATGAARRAAGRLGERNRRLGAALHEWSDQTRLWASDLCSLLPAAGVNAPAATAFVGQDHAAPGDHEAVRARLLSESDDLVGHWQATVAAIDLRLAEERSAAQEAQALVAELAERTEPDPPRLGWQMAVDHCLADLVDFAPHLDDVERAGIEAALQSSGLLSARLIDDATAELANGELVAIVAGGAPSPLSDCLKVTVPDRLIGVVDEGLVTKLLQSISRDPLSDAATVISTDGAFRVGSLRGRHSKQRAEFIGMTARLAALDRARSEAAERLDQARAVVAGRKAERAERVSSLDRAKRHRSVLPSTGAIITARAEADAATAANADAAAEEAEAEARAAEAEQVSVSAWDALQRLATTLSLPADRHGLDAVRRELRELDSVLDRCRSRLDALHRSVDHWRNAVGRWRKAADDLRAERDALSTIKSKHSREHVRLATIEDSIGEEYAAVVATRGQRKTEMEEVETRLPAIRRRRDEAVERRAERRAAARAAAAESAQAFQACDAMRLSLTEVLATPGLLDAIVDPAAPTGAIVARSVGSDGLSEILDAVERLLPDGSDEATNADGVRQSLMRRRDALGAGWDAEARQPDPALPLVVDVTGPLGRAPLAASVRAVSQQHRHLASLLDRKQGDALRELLQGLIAREIAEKVHGAGRLVDLMNQRLGAVTTAHQVGVRLRWRRSPEIDQTTARMVDLLAKLPDLRTDDDERELRRALSERLDEARAQQPDLPYRQLIADTLDYKQWHEMSVMVRRTGSKDARLTRNTPLSEGEKKLVTYLPLFAAVAASYDALAEQRNTPGEGPPGIARFILLDDAFAKVSEDNHPALFGLLVDLDLDLVATSERLWGTYRTVPELAITEVIRDATLGVILLEHYRWDGAVLELRDAP